MAKKVYFNQEAREKITKGINILANAVGSTLGARGKGVVISSGYGHMPIVTKDGVSVAKSVFLEDEVENTGAMLIRGAAEKTLETCGDGTTTSVVLAQSIINNGLDEIAKGCNVQEVKSGIDKAVDCVVKELKSMSIPVTTNEVIKNVATISANNDAEIGGLIAEAYDKIGLGGLLTIDDSKTIDTYVEVMEGAEMARGYASDKFVTDRKRMEVVYDGPMVLVMDYEIRTFKELEPIMKQIAATAAGFSRPWIIIAKGFDGEIFNTMVVNREKNGNKICLIQAPAAYQKEALNDVAVLTGAKLICDEAGLKPEHAKLEDMGTCKKIIVSKTKTLIVGGDTDKEKLEYTKNDINLQIKNTTNNQLKEILEKRMARLTGSIGVIYVGGATDVETRERKDRVDDAVRAVKCAIEEGVVAGGGVALLKCAGFLRDNASGKGDEIIGAALVIKALSSPLEKMLQNAGETNPAIVPKVVSSKDDNYGYNVKTGTFGDLFDQGIMDPCKVARCALQNAASVAGQVLTSDVLMVEMKPV